jgi:DNA-binding MarR family transcriptional regulator
VTTRKELIESVLHSVQIMRRSFAPRGGQWLQLDITPAQWGVLMIVAKRQTTSVKDIAAALHVSSSGATQLIDGLVDKGYLTRQTDSADRRSTLIELSAPHRQRLREMRERYAAHFAHAFDALTTAELAEFDRLHKKIANTLEKQRNTDDPGE